MSLSIPEGLKIRGNDVKWIWKQIVKDKLPETIIKRRKIGFGIPIIAWMRNELYPYIQNELLSAPDVVYKYFDKRTIEKLLVYHKEGRADYSNHIWSMLLLKNWLCEFFDYGK